jgi:transporter family-2 protein
VAELDLRRLRAGDREQRVALLPEDVRVVGPAVLEAEALAALEDLDEPRVRRVGEDGDSEAEQVPSISLRKRPAVALVFLVLALLAGGALPFQAGINARLATFVGGPIRASAISFAVGTVVLVVVSLIATRGVVSTGRLGSVPWWGWLGGVVGAGYVASTVAAAPRLGALNLFAAVIFGQLACSVVLDHYGVLYREHQLNAGRIAGVVLLAAGVGLVRFF